MLYPLFPEELRQHRQASLLRTSARVRVRRDGGPSRYLADPVAARHRSGT